MYLLISKIEVDPHDEENPVVLLEIITVLACFDQKILPNEDAPQVESAYRL